MKVLIYIKWSWGLGDITFGILAEVSTGPDGLSNIVVGEMIVLYEITNYPEKEEDKRSTYISYKFLFISPKHIYRKVWLKIQHSIQPL